MRAPLRPVRPGQGLSAEILQHSYGAWNSSPIVSQTMTFLTCATWLSCLQCFYESKSFFVYEAVYAQAVMQARWVWMSRSCQVWMVCPSSHIGVLFFLPDRLSKC